MRGFIGFILIAPASALAIPYVYLATNAIGEKSAIHFFCTLMIWQALREFRDWIWPDRSQAATR